MSHFTSIDVEILCQMQNFMLKVRLYLYHHWAILVAHRATYLVTGIVLPEISMIWWEYKANSMHASRDVIKFDIDVREVHSSWKTQKLVGGQETRNQNSFLCQSLPEITNSWRFTSGLINESVGRSKRYRPKSGYFDSQNILNRCTILWTSVILFLGLVQTWYTVLLVWPISWITCFVMVMLWCVCAVFNLKSSVAIMYELCTHDWAQNVQRAIAQVGFNSKYWLHCYSSFRVTRPKIENLRWQFGDDIDFITYRTFVTSLVQKLKKKYVHKIMSQGTDYKSVYSHF